MVIMGDVTYGACCIDDFTAIGIYYLYVIEGVGCDFMIHYGHSCLIPIDKTCIKTLYVFVDVKFDTKHFIDTIKANFEVGSKIAAVGTIQFVATLQQAVQELILDGEKRFDITVPQARPLSKGEILGCTAPNFEGRDLIIYLGDGRFHLEAIMIANPHIKAFRYDPYSKVFSRESYDHDEMQSLRLEAVYLGKKAKKFGLIVGTLGRQGSPKVMDYIASKLDEMNIPYVIVLLSEIVPAKLGLFKDDIDCWIQISCPRLSIDWGYAFPKPLLTPYEFAVVVGEAPLWSDRQDGRYPMDFYSKESLGPWTPNHQRQK